MNALTNFRPGEICIHGQSLGLECEACYRESEQTAPNNRILGEAPRSGGALLVGVQQNFFYVAVHQRPEGLMYNVRSACVTEDGCLDLCTDPDVADPEGPEGPIIGIARVRLVQINYRSGYFEELDRALDSEKKIP